MPLLRETISIFFTAQGITINSAVNGNEGHHASHHNVIDGNTLTNGIDRHVIDARNNGFDYIIVGGLVGNVGGLAAVPGENDTATGTIVDLYEYFLDSTGPIPHNYNTVVTNNVCSRTIPNDVALSSLGFGMFYMQDGPQDAALTPESMHGGGVLFWAGTSKNILVDSNIFSGIGAAARFHTYTKLVNCKFTNNTIFDCFVGVSTNDNELSHGFEISGNIFDMDPLLKHANRGAAGTYLEWGDPTALKLGAAYGFTIARNTFKNCGRVVDNALLYAEYLLDGRNTYDGNTIECQPVAVGFNTGNKGMGTVNNGMGFVARIVDCDPLSATYGDVLNTCQRYSPEMPDSGIYVAGHFIENMKITELGSTGSKYVIRGWLRANTGDSHVEGVDWFALKVPTGN